MRKILVATVAAVVLAASAGSAHATLTYTIWNGTGLKKTADFAVPGGSPFASFTDTNDTLNFDYTAPQGSANTFADFFATASNAATIEGECNASHAGCTTTVMSTLDAPNGTDRSTFIEITGSYFLASDATSNLAHDDGAQIFLDGNSTALCGAAAEAALTSQSCTFPTGSHSFVLLYTEDNGSPSILQVTLPPETAVPEPATMFLGGLGLIAFGFAARRRLFGR